MDAVVYGLGFHQEFLSIIIASFIGASALLASVLIFLGLIVALIILITTSNDEHPLHSFS